MTADRRPSAIVIGGGIGGLTAAAAALHHFNTVTVIDRDELLGSRVATEGIRETAKRRSGVPQYTQPHILLAAGAKSLNELIPGFTEELVKRGANAFDGGDGLRIYDFGGQYIRSNVGVELYGASRRLVNETLQDMLIAQSGERLKIKDETEVAELLWESAAEAAARDASFYSADPSTYSTDTSDSESSIKSSGSDTGVARGDIRGVILCSGEQLLADIVIVSDGRKSQLPQWLKEANIKMPETLKVDCKMNCASRWMRVPKDFDPSKEFYGTLCVSRGQQTRGGAADLVENRMVQVMLFGAGDDKVPTDEQGWRAFAASLPDKAIAELINRSEPLTPVMHFPGVPNIHPQYHKTKLPDGLFVVGDAFMALNSVYGQGMTVAAMGAVLLDETLREAAYGSRCVGGEGMTRHLNAVRAAGSRFHTKQAKQGSISWNMSIGEDMRYADVEITGVKSLPRVLYKYMDALMVACHKDAKAWKQVVRVVQLLDPPSKLFSPGMLRWGLLGLARGDANKCRKMINMKKKGSSSRAAAAAVEVMQGESSSDMEEKLDFKVHMNVTSSVAVTA